MSIDDEGNGPKKFYVNIGLGTKLRSINKSKSFIRPLLE
jgi:hypothetical protein